MADFIISHVVASNPADNRWLDRDWKKWANLQRRNPTAGKRPGMSGVAQVITTYDFWGILVLGASLLMSVYSIGS